jgi:O-antigen ligase
MEGGELISDFHRSKKNKNWQWLSVMLLLTIGISMASWPILDHTWLSLIPPAILAFLLLLLHYEWLLYIGLALIPLSTELDLSGGLSLDFPIELVMIAMSAVLILLAFYRLNELPAGKFAHPLAILLLMHVSWMVVSCFFTTDLLVSVKFLLAKAWYIGSFFFFVLYLFRGDRLQGMLNWFFIPLTATVVLVLARHAMEGFSFDSVNEVLNPFYRNHVNYSALLAIGFPFLYYSWRMNRLLKWIMVLFFLVAIYFTYTRAAYIAVLGGMAYFVVVRFRLTRFFVLGAIISGAVAIFSVVEDSRYLAYAPDYQKTIAHKNFDDLIEATYEFQDVSTMEMVYRWVAGFNMIGERPVTGYGPGGFYENYKNYTVSSFKTYISTNEERSGIHSYYLMTAVEQGLPGLVLYLLLVIATLFYAEGIFHRLSEPQDRRLCLSAVSALVVIHLFQIINDLVEAHKVGALFFLSTAIIVYLDHKSRLTKEENIRDT